MRAGMSYFHETIWKGVPKFLRRVDTALKNIGINERLPYNVPLIQFSSWMGGDRDGTWFFSLYQLYILFQWFSCSNFSLATGQEMFPYLVSAVHILLVMYSFLIIFVKFVHD